MIAGGGETGFHLARALDGRRFGVVMMETDERRCEYLANTLSHVTVVKADATRRAVLEEERVGSADVFVSCTGDDEANIIACVEAKEMGAPRVMAIVQRPDYAQIVANLGVDLAVSPRDVMARQVLGFLNMGVVVSRSNMAGSSISLLELEVLAGTPAVEHVLANLALPRQSLIAAVMREGYVQVPGADEQLLPGDTVVTLTADAAEDQLLEKFTVQSQ